MGNRNLTDTAISPQRGGSDSTVARTCHRPEYDIGVIRVRNPGQLPRREPLAAPPRRRRRHPVAGDRGHGSSILFLKKTHRPRRSRGAPGPGAEVYVDAWHFPPIGETVSMN